MYVCVYVCVCMYTYIHVCRCMYVSWCVCVYVWGRERVVHEGVCLGVCTPYIDTTYIALALGAL